MRDVFKNFVGTMKSFFRVGGPTGNGIKNEVDGLGVRNSDDSAYQNVRIKQATGSVDEHGVNWRDLRDQTTLMQFAFDGGSPPSPGSNTGAYGICHTSGGTYSAGQVYYDNGSELVPVKLFVGAMIATGSAVSGTINLVANGVYVAHSASAPYNWTLKGDGAPQAIGYVRRIRIPIDTSASKTSTTSIPADAQVLEVVTEIENPYDNNAEISVVIDGSVSDMTIQPSNEINPAVAAIYSSEGQDEMVDSDTEGPVRVDITNSPSSGSGNVIVKYTEQFLG